MESFYNKSCEIYSYEKNDEWDSKEKYYLKNSCRCRVRSISSTEIKQSHKATHRVYLPIIEGLKITDRFKIDYNFYEIVSEVKDAGGFQSHHLEVDVMHYVR